jgi:Transcriptional regulatory protein, C terminal
MSNVGQPIFGGLSMLSTPVKLSDDLELDWRAYELRRSGQPIRLSRIPVELLFLLVERRGELVTRDEIVARIWGKDVFLDTDAKGKLPERAVLCWLIHCVYFPRHQRRLSGYFWLTSSLRACATGGLTIGWRGPRIG